MAESIGLKVRKISVTALRTLHSPYKIPGLLPVALIFLYWSELKLPDFSFFINFLVRCQHENVIPNFLKFRLANKDLQNSVTYRNVN